MADATNFLRFACCALLALLAGACATNVGFGPVTSATAPLDPSDAKNRSVKIAMLLPLGGYGPTAVIAKAMKQAGEMALFDLNNPSIQLIVKDDKGTAEGARAAADEAIREGAEIILGPLLAQAVPGAAVAARPANVPILAFSNDTAVAGNGVYLMSFLVEPEVQRIVSFAAAQGRTRFAALIPDDAYGRAVEPAFQRAVQQAGGTVVELRRYPMGANGLLGPAKEIFAAIGASEARETPVDALFVPGGQEALPHLGPLIAYSGIDTSKVKLLGTGAWEFPNIGRDEAFAGGWYPGPDPAGWRSFAERFAKTFGVAPPRVASLAYDAVGAAVSLSAHPRGVRFTTANLTRAGGFSGVDGVVRFGPNGLSERGLAILEVQKFGSAVVESAPGGVGSNRLSSVQPRIDPP